MSDERKHCEEVARDFQRDRMLRQGHGSLADLIQRERADVMKQPREMLQRVRDAWAKMQVGLDAANSTATFVRGEMELRKAVDEINKMLEANDALAYMSPEQDVKERAAIQKACYDATARAQKAEARTEEVLGAVMALIEGRQRSCLTSDTQESLHHLKEDVSALKSKVTP